MQKNKLHSHLDFIETLKYDMWDGVKKNWEKLVR